MGAKNVQVRYWDGISPKVSTLEVVEEDFLSQYEKIYGAILLFPYTKKYVERSKELFQLDPSSLPGLTFVPQVIYGSIF